MRLPPVKLTPSDAGTPENTAQSAVIVRLAMTYLKPFRWQMAFAVLAAVVVASTSSLATVLIGQVVNTLDGKGAPKIPGVHGAFNTLLVIATITMVLAAVRAIAGVAQAWTVNGVGHRLVGQMQIDLFGKVIRSDMARLQVTHSGSVIAAMLYDADLVRSATTTVVINYLQNALQIAFLLAVMAHADFSMTACVVLVGPLMGAVTQRFTRWGKKANSRAMEETSSLSSAIMEGVGGVKVVKVDNREAFEQERIAEVIARRQTHIIKGANIGASVAPAIEVIMSWVIAGAIVYVGWRISQGRLLLGDLFAFFGALLMAGQALRQLANMQPVFIQGLTAAERIFAVMDTRPHITDAPNATPLPMPARGVALSHVDFSYRGSDEATLENVTLHVDRGETIALVGPSGGGKSTILNLIPRFYDVSAGTVTIDGHDVRGLTLTSLRDQIGLVTQEPFLFDDTIAANIAYTRPDASQTEIEAAAREAAAHDFITAFPLGYETRVGEGGTRLSGGQRQRVAIARAFLKNAPILLLDEATSALDADSESQVQAALERLMQGRATILIAHRLSTVRRASRIYVIDQGKVVETGTHLSLVNARGTYFRLAHVQDLVAEPGAPDVPRY